MLDKMTFIIFMIKLFGLQIVLLGIYFGVIAGRSKFEILICIGSLIFAIGSNILLGVTRNNSRK
jgi:hypothetical protein